MAIEARLQRHTIPFTEKLVRINFSFIVAILAIGAIGYLALYSAARGSHDPWALRHAARLGIGLGLLLVIALIDIRFWFQLAYPAYAAGIALLIAVEVTGAVGKGAQRWIDLGFMQLQPSELMKITLVLALARLFHTRFLEELGNPVSLLAPLALVFVPALLVLKQPDLGTALMLVAAGGALFFVAGVRWWKFVLVIGSIAALLPVAIGSLKEYQQQRVLTFLDPERDPLGAGYHIIQSKIALGSGGLWGKGFLQGTQSQLSFLPEKQTDFIFTLYAEEFGLVGALILLLLFGLVIAFGIAVSMRVQSHFARLLAIGLSFNFFLYVMINISMITGMMPVVGVPLPLVSYGGTAMLTIMIGFGLILSADIHREIGISRFST